jgi:hypothetical protein
MRIDRQALGANHGLQGLRHQQAVARTVRDLLPHRQHFPGSGEVEFLDLGKKQDCEVHGLPPGGYLPASTFFAWATLMSRGSRTPFFTARISAITLTAISGGVLLPM